MIDSESAAALLEAVFERIHKQQMQDIPILNRMLRVETLGFQCYQGRIIGVLITPWLMNLVMLPGEEDHWEALELGKKVPQEFPSGTYKFMVNDIEGIGRCQTHSLFSPMNEFSNQEHALAAARSFMAQLLVAPEDPQEVQVDEELLGRILRGEETPDLDQFAQIEPHECTSRPVRGVEEGTVEVRKKISRRELLRGDFLKNS